MPKSVRLIIEALIPSEVGILIAQQPVDGFGMAFVDMAGNIEERWRLFLFAKVHVCALLLVERRLDAPPLLASPNTYSGYSGRRVGIREISLFNSSATSKLFMVVGFGCNCEILRIAKTSWNAQSIVYADVFTVLNLCKS
jgi:hypothetical protein